MARSLGGFLVLVIVISICEAASLFYPISDGHRSAALELFKPIDGSFGSLQETYEAIRTFEVLGIEKKTDTSTAACRSVADTVGSPSSAPKELFYALKINGILKCQINGESLEGIIPGLKAGINGASSLLDFYYLIGSLALVKDQAPKSNAHLEDAPGIFRSIKAFSQSDGRWRYSSNNPQSSTFAAGIALETLAGVVSLASSGIDQSLISTLKSDILKLFDTIENYDDGAYYFDEKIIDGSEDQGPLSTTSLVVRGITAFATVNGGNLNLPGEKILGLGNFFLGIGIPGDAKDFFYQIDSLACLESNRVSVPLILSVPSTVLSLPKKDSLKVRVNTVLNSNAPPLSVRLVKAFTSGSRDASVIESQELKFDAETGSHALDDLPKRLDVGSYIFVFEVVLHESEHEKVYTTGRQTEVPVFITGIIKVDSAEIAVLDSDLGNVETQKKLDLSGETATSLTANHLQKLRLLFELTTPYGKPFRPHQALLKLRHATGVEHTFVMGNSGKRFDIVLDFLGLVEKFFYLTGKYDLELTVGDAVMENSFMQAIGHIDLDLPEPPEKAAHPAAQPVDPYSRYGPKAEITHIFRAPEKLPPKELSLTFLGLTLLPLVGFLVGLLRIGVNLKNFPTKPTPAAFAALFHGGIGAVLLLYGFFWLKLDLFTTLKFLGLLGTFLLVVGHRTLSHLAAASAKLKSA